LPLILRSEIAERDELFHLIALLVAGPILAHSSTDVLAARWLKRGMDEVGQPAGSPSPRGPRPA
jgi:hypothetical protein